MKRFAPLILTALIGGTPAFAADPADTLLEARIEAHITFLADDLLRGRQPGTDGYEIAARYVASQFRQAARRPSWSVLDSSALQEDLGIEVADLAPSLRACLKEIKNNEQNSS